VVEIALGGLAEQEVGRGGRNCNQRLRRNWADWADYGNWPFGADWGKSLPKYFRLKNKQKQ